MKGGIVEFIVEHLMKIVSGGGSEAIIALLILIIVALISERKRLLKEVEVRDKKIDKIIDDVIAGNTTLTEALDSLRTVLYEIKGRLF